MASLILDDQFLKEIVNALSLSINPDNQIRGQAEQYLKQAQHRLGYASALLKISGDKSLIGKC